MSLQTPSALCPMPFALCPLPFRFASPCGCAKFGRWGQRQRLALLLVVPKGLAKKKQPHGLPSAFHLPISAEDDPDQLNAAIDALMAFAQPAIDKSVAQEGFEERLADLGIPLEHNWRWLSNLRLMRWLLQEPATDTVWRFVLKNAYRPFLFTRRKFAFVIGNPPWLSYRYIQRGDYQAQVRELVLQHYKLLEGKDAHLFTQMEMATLFFAFCADRYLADGGTIAFVMPRSILTGAKQHAVFRQKFVATADLLIDRERVTPLFNVPTCVIVWRKDAAKKRQASVPTLRLQGDLPRKNAAFAEVWGSKLQASETTYTPPVPMGKSPYFERVIQGATIVPRCLWFVRPPETARVIDRDRPQLETDPSIEPQAKPLWKGVRLSGSVEAEFLFATLLSDDLLPFGWRRFSLVVLLLSDGELLEIDAALRKGKTGLADWLRRAETVWRQHGKVSARVRSVYNRLDYDGNLTRQNPTGVVKLLYSTSGTHLCACVVDVRNVSGWQVYDLPVQGFIADTTTYWLETDDPDEAHYLCAMLNAPMVDEFIKPFQTKGAFGAQKGKGERHIHRRPFEVLPIPQFNYIHPPFPNYPITELPLMPSPLPS